MTKETENTLDVGGIIEFFGGKHAIVAAYEQEANKIISVKAVEKWLERNSLSTANILTLKSIAGKRKLKFKLEDYIN